MQERRLRLGDVLDDYCPREKRLSNHVIGAADASSAARLAILAALITLGIAVYFATLRLLRVMTLKELAALQRKS